MKPDGEHEPSGFCCLRVSKFFKHDHKIYTYSGDNVLQEFFKYIKQEQDTIDKILSTNLPINTLTDEESRAHDAATACFTCERPFTTANVKTHHHCHITGKYIAPVCNNCNLQLKHRKRNNKHFVPLFHKIYTYSGDNVLQEFFKYIKQEQDTIDKILLTNLPINTLTDEKSKAHDAATACFTCERPFTTANVKTHYHCHITGKYIAPVCNNCKL